MEGPIYSRPAQVDDALYLATASRLYFIATNGLTRISQAEEDRDNK
jgi:hypothetical protein